MNIDRVPKTSTVTLENEISDTTPLLPKEPHVPLGLRPSIGEEVTTDGKHVKNSRYLNLRSRKTKSIKMFFSPITNGFETYN